MAQPSCASPHLASPLLSPPPLLPPSSPSPLPRPSPRPASAIPHPPSARPPPSALLPPPLSPPSTPRSPPSVPLSPPSPPHASLPPASPPRPPAPPLLVKTVAGCGRRGCGDGAADFATFASPHHCLSLPDSSLLVADTLNGCVRRIHRAADAVRVARVGEKASLLCPKGLALLPDGDVLVCDSGHHRLRRLCLADGRVTTYAGSGKRGHRDGSAEKAQFDAPCGVCVCADGAVLVADSGNRKIRTLSWQTGRLLVDTLLTLEDGGGFVLPTSAVSMCGGAGMVYVADTGGHTIYALCPTEGGYSASIVAGMAGHAGHADGELRSSLFSSPGGLALQHDGRLLVADTNNSCIRRLCFSSRTVETVAGSLSRAWGNQDGTAVGKALFNLPRGIGVGPKGEIWVADSGNHSIRVVRAEGSSPFPTPREPPASRPLPAATAFDEAVARKVERLTASRTVAAAGRPPRPSGSADASRAAAAEASGGLPRRRGDLSSAAEAPGGAASAPRDEEFTAQLFKRSAATGGHHGWVYAGAATLSLQRAFGLRDVHAVLCVTVNGAAAAEVQLARREQLVLRDQLFLLCSPPAEAAAVEIGLRFRSPATARQLLSMCAALMGEGMTRRKPPAAGRAVTRQDPPLVEQNGRHGSTTSLECGSRKESMVDEAVSTTDIELEESSKDDRDSALEQQASEIERLANELADRDQEISRLRSRLELAEARALARDAKIAELSRRLRQQLNQDGECGL